MSEKSSISLIVADDHAMVRLGLEQAVSRQPDMTLLAALDNGEETVEAYRELQPDVLLLDYRMPDLNGAEVTMRIRSFDDDATILIHSAYNGEEDIWKAARAGVSGYLTKDSDILVTLDAIRRVAKGSTFFPPSIQSKLESRSARKALTRRELEVLQLLSLGMSNKEIMVQLSVSAATVRHHVSNILEKLLVNDRTQAVVKAARCGIIHFD